MLFLFNAGTSSEITNAAAGSFSYWWLLVSILILPLPLCCFCWN